MKPDFNDYNLALIKEGKIIFQSDKKGLRPIIETVRDFKNKIDDCVLYDKVVGLAAARMIVYGGFITEVYTKIISKPAFELLTHININVKYENITPNILMKDKRGICPMEKKAMEITDNSKFFNETLERFYPR
jgi:hypothetical protein